MKAKAKYFALICGTLIEISREQYNLFAVWNDEYCVLNEYRQYIVTIWQVGMKPKRKINWPETMYLVNPDDGFIWANSTNRHYLFAVSKKTVKREGIAK